MDLHKPVVIQRQLRREQYDGSGAIHMRKILKPRRTPFSGDCDVRFFLAIQEHSDPRSTVKLAAQLDKSETLLLETQHRFANSLQIVASVLLSKARSSRSPEARTELENAHRRIMSIAAIQQQFTTSAFDGDIEIGPYLERLCGSLKTSMLDESRPITIEVRTDNARVAYSSAVSIGLIATELCINALKHAFVGRTNGAIVVSYFASSDCWQLVVSDDGIGILENAVAKAVTGSGAGILAALARHLDGRIEVATGPDGCSVSITGTSVNPVLSLDRGDRPMIASIRQRAIHA